ncbi:MAG: hypothetical protein M1817_001017 [Caeruleum heppii]|nr:MAG: hypothetical protein M1817_001017 [Caeruleum heppii]
MTTASPDSEPARSPGVDRAIDAWRRTGEFPFPEMQFFPPLSVEEFSPIDLRLIHHIASVSRQMHFKDASRYTIWTGRVPVFLKIASSYTFVLHAILALSATHLAWASECSATGNIAYHHRGIALKGLQEAIGQFSRDNSDAILAASILLSLQSTEWDHWSSLMWGTSSVVEAMRPWKSASYFEDFMDEQSAFPLAPPSPRPSAEHHAQANMATLQHVMVSLQEVKSRLPCNDRERRALSDLISFVRQLGSALPAQGAAEQFKLLQPLRSWLIWLPTSILQQKGGSPGGLIVLAHFYAVALAIEPLFVALGAAFFGSMSLAPLEAIIDTLISGRVPAEGGMDVEELLSFPLEMVRVVRTRISWIHQNAERHESFSPHHLGSSFAESRPPMMTQSSPQMDMPQLRLHDASFSAAYDSNGFSNFESYAASPTFLSDAHGLDYAASAPSFTTGFVPPSAWT